MDTIRHAFTLKDNADSRRRLQVVRRLDSLLQNLNQTKMARSEGREALRRVCDRMADGDRHFEPAVSVARLKLKPPARPG